MLNINQRHIILGLPIHITWEIKSRYLFCLMYFPMSGWMIWRNFKFVATKGERKIETHNEIFFQRNKQIKVKLYKFRWYGLILVESLEAILNDNYKEIDIQPIKTNEFQFELEQIKLTEKSKIKINTFDFKMKSVPLEVRTNVESLSFKGLNSEI